MPVFERLNEEAAKQGLKFLVIGGHAVMRHGFMRATEDADILANKEQRPLWQKAVDHLGYRLFHDGGTFLQMTPAAGIGWELDVMFVPQDTFQKMLTEALVSQIEGVPVLIPSLHHLLALKIHVLKHGHGLRVLKDTNDVIELARANRLDLHSDSFRRLFEQQGAVDVYERIVTACAG
jgi:hypothetical protein